MKETLLNLRTRALAPDAAVRKLQSAQHPHAIWGVLSHVLCLAIHALLGRMQFCDAGVVQGWMRAIRHAWVAAVLKPDRSITSSLSLTCCSTAQKKASQGTLSLSPADSQDPVDPKTILDVEVVTREAQVFVPSACLLSCPKCNLS